MIHIYIANYYRCIQKNPAKKKLPPIIPKGGKRRRKLRFKQSPTYYYYYHIWFSLSVVFLSYVHFCRRREWSVDVSKSIGSSARELGEFSKRPCSLVGTPPKENSKEVYFQKDRFQSIPLSKKVGKIKTQASGRSEDISTGILSSVFLIVRYTLLLSNSRSKNAFWIFHCILTAFRLLPSLRSAPPAAPLALTLSQRPCAACFAWGPRPRPRSRSLRERKKKWFEKLPARERS